MCNAHRKNQRAAHVRVHPLLTILHEKIPDLFTLTVFPDNAWALQRRDKRTATVLAGIRADGCNLHRLPKRVFKALSDRDESGALLGARPLTVAGAAQVRLVCDRQGPPASR